MSKESGRISFSARLLKAGSLTVVRLPRSASAKLPSRGMVMVEGTLNGSGFVAPLEPDGDGGHWLKVEKDVLIAAQKAEVEDTVALEIAVSEEWPEPEVPEDLKKMLGKNEKARRTWEATTPGAHWDWVRWVRSTKNPETRKKRVEVARSKLESGMRRPCCFNRNSCTEMEVSNNGVLLVAEEK